MLFFTKWRRSRAARRVARPAPRERGGGSVRHNDFAFPEAKSLEETFESACGACFFPFRRSRVFFSQENCLRLATHASETTSEYAVFSLKNHAIIPSPNGFFRARLETTLFLAARPFLSPRLTVCVRRFFNNSFPRRFPNALQNKLLARAVPIQTRLEPFFFITSEKCGKLWEPAETAAHNVRMNLDAVLPGRRRVGRQLEKKLVHFIQVSLVHAVAQLEQQLDGRSRATHGDDAGIQVSLVHHHFRRRQSPKAQALVAFESEDLKSTVTIFRIYFGKSLAI